MEKNFITLLEEHMAKEQEPKKFSYEDIVTLNGGNIDDFMLFIRDRDTNEIKDLTKITFTNGRVDYLHTQNPHTNEEDVVPYDAFLPDWEMVVVKRYL